MSSTSVKTSPFLKAGFLSRLFFWWLTPLFLEGKKRKGRFSETDLYCTIPRDRSQTHGDILEAAWNKELAKEGGPSLFRALRTVYGWKYCKLGALALIGELVFQLAQPLLLGRLIRRFASMNADNGSNEGGPEEPAWLLMLALLISILLYMITHHGFFSRAQILGMHIRIACSSLIYRQALKMKGSKECGGANCGQVLNHLSNDVNRFDVVLIFLHMIWIAPLQLAIVVYFLWGYFGVYCLTGIPIIILIIPLQATMAKLFGKLRSNTAKKTDERIGILNEVVSGIGIIKMQVWESLFKTKVSDARTEEMAEIKKTAWLKAVNLILHDISSKLIIFITLLVYVLSGYMLTSEKVFVTIALYNSVRRVCTFCAPQGICNLAETRISINRIQEFLLQSTKFQVHPLCDLNPQQSQEQTLNSNLALKFHSFSASWDGRSKTLSKINFSLEKGELLIVVGKTGAGKSSLLQAILGELKCKSGGIQVNIGEGKVSYAPQQPWLYDGTIRDNILFGAKFESRRYYRVIEACALKHDLASFPLQDLTLVGDTKANCLSGGQKSRINLARAVYAFSDIVLLDDPFSAVDSSVANHIFNTCIHSLLQNRTTILVTHQTQFLSSMKNILMLENGVQVRYGSYMDYRHAGINFEPMEKDDGDLMNYHGKLKISRTLSGPRPMKKKLRRVISSTSETIIEGWIEEVPEVEEDDEIQLNCFHKEGDENHEACCDVSETSEGKLPKEIRNPGPRIRSRNVYKEYFKAGSSIFGQFLLVSMICLKQVFYTGSDYWLQIWVKDEQRFAQNATIHDHKDVHLEEIVQEMLKQDVEIYILIFCGSCIFGILKTWNFFRVCIQASIHLHRKLFNSVLNAPISFFLGNSTGKILNVFTKDMGVVDDAATNVLGVLVVVSLVNYILLIPSIILIILFIFVRGLYIETAKSIKRIEALTKWPVFSHTSQTLKGIDVIRAFGQEREFLNEFDNAQDLHTSAWVLVIGGSRWLAFMVEFFSLGFIGCVAFSFIIFAKGGASVGLAISSALTLSALFQYGVRQSCEAESQLISVERIVALSKLPSETPEQTITLKKSDDDEDDWPKEGKISFKELTISYVKRNEGDEEILEEKIVLDKLFFDIQPGHKVGVVGRTGAGKSTLVSALFRLMNPSSGSVVIDGIDISNLSLDKLRSKLSIIPQEPMLLRGTIRQNLDPQGKNGDESIWEALEKVSMKEHVIGLHDALDSKVIEGFFSIGQKQLLCLCRALLQRNKILVLDEATAALDKKTDEVIQKTIVSNFAHCTTLTIAHRLDTVAQSDRILVLDAGKLVEYESPVVLLKDRKSAFYKMVSESQKPR